MQNAQKQKRIIYHRDHGTGYYEIKYQIRVFELARNYIIPYKTASGSNSLATQSHYLKRFYVLRDSWKWLYEERDGFMVWVVTQI